MDIEPCDGDIEEAIEKVKYEGEISADDFSPTATLKKTELKGSSCTLNADITTAFLALFGTNSAFVKQWREKARKDRNFEVGDWSTSQKFCGVRMFRCQTSVTELFTAKWEPFVERQRFVFANKTIYVHFSSMTPKVTFGDTFRVEALIELRDTGGQTSLTAYAYIHFLKSAMLEGKIRSTATSEVGKSFRFLAQLAPDVVKQFVDGQGGGKKRKGKTRRRDRDAADSDREARSPSMSAAAPPTFPEPSGGVPISVVAALLLGILLTILVSALWQEPAVAQPTTSPALQLLRNDPQLIALLGPEGVRQLELASAKRQATPLGASLGVDHLGGPLEGLHIPGESS
eukprot:Sspe_Gene.41423::Locus_20025_Transcript_1_1_Confidence_1.000_Length_1131::g.41423::m.41423